MRGKHAIVLSGTFLPRSNLIIFCECSEGEHGTAKLLELFRHLFLKIEDAF